MVTFNTLNSLIADIQTEIANNNIAESSSISTRQIELWIHQYRALLLKQDIDKGRYMNPNYIQEINGAQLHVEDRGEISGINTSDFRLKSCIMLPKTIDLHFKPALWLTDILGNNIQLMPETRAIMQKNRKYSSNDYVAYLKGDYLYVEGPTELEYINIKGVFEVPPSVGEVETMAGFNYYNYDALYPFPADKIGALKQIIFQNEFGILLSTPVDSTNNTDNSVEVDGQGAPTTIRNKKR